VFLSSSARENFPRHFATPEKTPSHTPKRELLNVCKVGEIDFFRGNQYTFVKRNRKEKNMNLNLKRLLIALPFLAIAAYILIQAL